MDMSSDDEDIILLWWLRRRRKRRSRRRFWIHPLINPMQSSYIVVKELNRDPDKFQFYYRMTKETFDVLLRLVGPSLQKQNTRFRIAKTSEEKLIITLRYLASGLSFKALAQDFMLGATTVGIIIGETTEAIWKYLQPLYLPVPDMAKWNEIADRFEKLHALPHCIGALDGKCCRIKKFDNTGSQNYNYKQYFSVQLMASVDADGCFITVDVGDYGRNSDGGVFRSSRLGRSLQAGSLCLPPAKPLQYDPNGIPFPFYFIGDEAFPLKKYLLRPYARANLTDPKRIFNYRLSIGRKTVECAFGMMTSKFRIFHTPIACTEKKVFSIIKCCCVLHNFIRQRDGKQYDERSFRPSHSEYMQNQLQPRLLNSGTNIRDYLCDYFLLPDASVHPQWKVVIGT